MKVHGIDFTSAPSSRKPITNACCEFEGEVLRLCQPDSFSTLSQFEALLARPGPWIAGLDFPFGQPRRLIENLHWPNSWEGYVAAVAALGKAGWVETLKVYRAARPSRDKQHLRVADTKAKSQSPMMAFGVPLAKMFFEGAPRLLASGASVLPVHPTLADRVVVEAYPALVARKFVSFSSYKNDEKRKQTAEQEEARGEIIAGLRSDAVMTHYGFKVLADAAIWQMMIDDPSGDILDALLAAIQAAWAWHQGPPGYGIPKDSDSLEGWIVDPEMILP